VARRPCIGAPRRTERLALPVIPHAYNHAVPIAASESTRAEASLNQPPPIRVAVIDTDTGFVTVLARRFDAAGWQHRTLTTAVPPGELVAMKVNALVLDPARLDEAGSDYLEQVCGMLPDVGVVVCTMEATIAERVKGLRLGADDWISKPCHPEEVAARIEAVVRRHRRGRVQADLGPMVAGEIEVRPDQYQCFVGGQSLDLTRREFELIHVLAGVQGRVMDRESLYQRVWGYAMAHGDRSVDVFVRKLRQKLERRSPGWTYIHTHVGVGYRFDPEQQTGRDGSQDFHSSVTDQ
jgi:DNA-binding response OmpR family regulator